MGVEDGFFSDKSKEEFDADKAATRAEYGNAPTEGPIEFRDRLLSVQGDQRRAAMDLFSHAGDAAGVRGGQLRGDLGRRMIGEMRSGNALGARQAQVVGARAMGGAAGDVARMGSEARLSAAQQVMGAEAQRAAYEQAVMDDYLTRMGMAYERQRREGAALEAEQAARAGATQQMVGAGIGAFGSAMAGTAGILGQYGGQTVGGPARPAAYSGVQYTSGAGNLGAYSGYGKQAPASLGSGSDYYSSAYEQVYGGRR